MSATLLSLEEIRVLAFECLTDNGASADNAAAMAETIMTAERDGSHSHGLFRLPAYVASLRSGKINGNAVARIEVAAAGIIRVHGDNGFATPAHNIGIPKLVEAAQVSGVAVLAVTHVHHMAALWPEVERIAEHDLVGMACTAYMPAVAPSGAKKALFGTNPMAFAWPRPGKSPVIYDMATAAMAKGEIQIAAREGREVPPGTGLDNTGSETTNAEKIIDGGVLLPFGGHKGSNLAMMVELLAAGLLGEYFSYEAKAADNGDGGPCRGGEWLLAMSPRLISGGDDWERHCEAFFNQLSGLDGVRLPGARRHANRRVDAPRQINTALLEKIYALNKKKSK